MRSSRTTWQSSSSRKQPLGEQQCLATCAFTVTWNHTCTGRLTLKSGLFSGYLVNHTCTDRLILESGLFSGYLVRDVLNCELREASQGNGLLDDGEGCTDHGLTCHTGCGSSKHKHKLQTYTKAHHINMITLKPIKHHHRVHHHLYNDIRISASSHYIG